MSSSNLKNFRDVDVIGGQISPFQLTLHVLLITGYRAACDQQNRFSAVPTLFSLVLSHREGHHRKVEEHIKHIIERQQSSTGPPVSVQITLLDGNVSVQSTG